LPESEKGEKDEREINCKVETEEISWDGLPIRKIMYGSDKSMICGGYDYFPILFSKTENKW